MDTVNNRLKECTFYSAYLQGPVATEGLPANDKYRENNKYTYRGNKPIISDDHLVN